MKCKFTSYTKSIFRRYFKNNPLHSQKIRENIQTYGTFILVQFVLIPQSKKKFFLNNYSLIFTSDVKKPAGHRPRPIWAYQAGPGLG
jgi:hypothetical protein